VHKYIQDLIRKVAEDRGFEVSIEETVLDGHGYVDVTLVRDDLRIACEISITTRVPHEVRNLAKCLAAGFAYAVLISEDERALVAAAAEFAPPDDRIRFLTPDGFISFLEELPGGASIRQGTKKKGNQGSVPFEKPATLADTKRLLGTEAAAEYLGLAVQTLAKMRVSGESPPFYKLGRQVLYDRAELDDWVVARKRRSTSDSGLSR
jgi:excisionase family DNA binding protein